MRGQFCGQLLGGCYLIPVGRSSSAKSPELSPLLSSNLLCIENKFLSGSLEEKRSGIRIDCFS